jgi:hypothetical protein
MNNTTRRNLTIVAIFMAATLVVGTIATTTITIGTTQQSAFAYLMKKKPVHDDKKDKTRDGDAGAGNGNGNTITIQACKQAATQSGFDNDQQQECENLICTHPGENATCVQEGAASAAQAQPVKLTCEQCFTKFLNADQISLLLQEANVPTLKQLCAVLPEIATEADLLSFLVGGLGLSNPEAKQLIQCLKDAGIVFHIDTDSVRTLR